MNGHEKKVGFFTDDAGNPSSLRIMSLISLLFAGLFGAAIIYLDQKELTGMVLTFLTGSFAPKLISRPLESWRDIQTMKINSNHE